MKVQVMRINSIKKSSKSELSSGIFDPSKVLLWKHLRLGLPGAQAPKRPGALAPGRLGALAPGRPGLRRFHCKTFEGSKIPEDNSDFDDFLIELILMT